MARGGDAPHDAVEPQVVPDAEDDDVARSPPRKKTTASTRIHAAVKGAKARLQELHDAVDNRKHAVTDENLRLQYEDAHKYAIRIFEAVTVNLEGEPVTTARQEVEAAAKKLWSVILDHNRGLRGYEQAMEAATIKKAQEEEEAQTKAQAKAALNRLVAEREQWAREKVAAEHERAALERQRAAAERERAMWEQTIATMRAERMQLEAEGAAKAERERVETELKAHRARAASMEGSGVYGAASSVAGSFGSSSTTPLHRQPAGSVHNRSVSLGNGYTIDRNGRFHDSRGHCSSNPYSSYTPYK